MGDESKNVKVKVERAGGMGLVWFMGWLFTIGYLHLGLLRAIYAILVWPFYLGRALAH